MTIAVVGSGVAGLACAEALGECVVFERLPVAGGEEWEHLREEVASCRAATFATGTQAIRWDGHTLQSIGFHGGDHAFDAVVIATGHRPSTAAELGIAGGRTSGIFPATVAIHLLHHGATLGRRVVVAGSGRWAEPVLAELSGAVHVDRVDAVRGAERVERVEVGDDALECDALVLAAGNHPYRNVDGAISQGPGVVFAQGPDSVEAGRRAAEEARREAARPSASIETVMRIGPPA